VNTADEVPLLSLFSNHRRQPLTKIYQRVNGSLRTRQSPLVKGTCETLAVPNAADLAALLEACQSHQALGLGVTDRDEQLVVAESLLAANPNAVTRSLSNFFFLPRPSWALIDTDFKGINDYIRDALTALGGVWPLLALIEPKLEHVAHVRRRSASFSLTDPNGKRLLPGGGHTYLLIDDGRRMRDVLMHLHKRCWALGLGYIRISESGQMLERSLIDISVASPERIVNEGPPIALPDMPGPGRSLQIDMSSRVSAYADGEALRCGTLEVIDNSEHEARVQAERERHTEASLAQALKHYANHHDLPRDQLEALAVSIASGRRCYTLPLSFTLFFKGKGWFSVKEILDNPSPFISHSKNTGPTLLDPLEPTRGDYCARLYVGTTDYSLFIRSFMHGETFYLLAPEVVSETEGDVAAFEAAFMENVP
jgi:hypothetical protein